MIGKSLSPLSDVTLLSNRSILSNFFTAEGGHARAYTFSKTRETYFATTFSEIGESTLEAIWKQKNQ